MPQLLELSTIPADLDHPECVAWGPDSRLYAGGEAGQIYRVDMATGHCEEYSSTGGNVLGITLDADANAYACDLARREVVRVAADGSTSVYSDGTAERRMQFPNYGVFDSDGNLYISDSGDWGAGNGVIWRIDPTRATEVWNQEARHYPNGMCLAADGGALYVVESTPPLISRVEIRKDGASGKREVVVGLPRTVPDGVALDQEGNLYISLYNPNIIYRLSPARELTVLYDDWEQLILLAPTNIAFAGVDLKTLAIANLCGRNLVTAPMPSAGLPLQYPVLG